MSVLAEATMEMGGVYVEARRDGGDVEVSITGPVDGDMVVLSEEQARWLFQIGGPTVLYRTEPEPKPKGRR